MPIPNEDSFLEPPKHQPYDSPLRWQIASRTNSHEAYVVDLGLPECQCRFWQCEVGPKLRKGLPVKKLCTHWHMARDRFASWAIDQFKKHDPNAAHDQEQLR